MGTPRRSSWTKSGATDMKGKQGADPTGLEKSAAIRPLATKKSRLASEKIFLVDSLATESLADRLATKLFFLKADNADADRT